MLYSLPNMICLERKPMGKEQPIFTPCSQFELNRVFGCPFHVFSKMVNHINRCYIIMLSTMIKIEVQFFFFYIYEYFFSIKGVNCPQNKCKLMHIHNILWFFFQSVLTQFNKNNVNFYFNLNAMPQWLETMVWTLMTRLW